MNNKIKVRQQSEDHAVLHTMGWMHLPVHTAYEIAASARLPYRKTLRILNRLRDTGRVSCVGNQHQIWWFSHDRVQMLGSRRF